MDFIPPGKTAKEEFHICADCMTERGLANDLDPQKPEDWATIQAVLSERTWKSQFGGEWEVPDQLANHPDFEDMSWRNDAAPSFHRKAKLGYWTVVIWVDHPDPEKREWPDPNGLGRFILCLWDDESGNGIDVCSHSSIDVIIARALNLNHPTCTWNA